MLVAGYSSLSMKVSKFCIVTSLFNHVLVESLYGRQMDTERGLYYLELREGISDQIQVILSGSLTGNTFYFKYSQEIQNLVPITFLQSKVYQPSFPPRNYRVSSLILP